MHYKAPSMSDYVAEQAGRQIAELLNLKADEKGRYKTMFGTKTLIGLARSVERVMFDAQENCKELFDEVTKEQQTTSV